MDKIKLILGASILLLVSVQVNAALITIGTADDGNIGTSGYPPVPDHIIGLGSIVNTGGSDYHRDILEYDISGLDSGNHTFTLDLTYQANQYDFGTYWLSWFDGDGVVTLDDWGRDVSLVSSFETEELRTETLSFDFILNTSLLGNFLGLRIEGQSNNSGNIRTQYQLQVSPVPAPPALLLFLTGIIGLIGFTRRKRISGSIS